MIIIFYLCFDKFKGGAPIEDIKKYINYKRKPVLEDEDIEEFNKLKTNLSPTVRTIINDNLHYDDDTILKYLKDIDETKLDKNLIIKPQNDIFKDLKLINEKSGNIDNKNCYIKSISLQQTFNNGITETKAKTFEAKNGKYDLKEYKNK